MMAARVGSRPRACLLVVLLGCCSRSGDPNLGTPTDFHARAAALGCRPQPKQFSGDHGFSCVKDLGACNCNMVLNVGTERKDDGTERVSQAVIDINNCNPGVGNDELMSLLDPLVTERGRLYEFLTTPKLLRDGEQVDELEVYEQTFFDHVPISVTFGAGSRIPRRTVWIGMFGPEETKLQPGVLAYQSCD